MEHYFIKVEYGNGQITLVRVGEDPSIEKQCEALKNIRGVKLSPNTGKWELTNGAVRARLGRQSNGEWGDHLSD